MSRPSYPFQLLLGALHMPPALDYLTWPLILMAGPLIVVTLAIVIIALMALTARRASTRRHCLNVLSQLTRFAGILRGHR